MDGVDNPPFIAPRAHEQDQPDPRRAVHRPGAGCADGRCACRKPKPRGDQIYFIGATNVPIDALDPALTRPGRMGRHVWFRTPTKQDRLDIFDLYLAKVAHDEELDRPERRDEIARITTGYSPGDDRAGLLARADVRAPRGQGGVRVAAPRRGDGRRSSPGTAIGIDYVPGETRAVAIHEAGHAVAGHVYMKGRESTRLSIRMRGGSLGHHQALEKEERFSRFRSEEIGLIIWGLGSMAAERVFYGETTNGVGGDLQSVTAAAAWMVGASGMGPERVELERRHAAQRPSAQAPAGGGAARGDHAPLRGDRRPHHEPRARTATSRTTPIASVLADRDKRRMVAQILGQAYMKAHHLILYNKDKVEHIAKVVIQKKEIYGDELVQPAERREPADSRRRPHRRQGVAGAVNVARRFSARVPRARRAARRRDRNARRPRSSGPRRSRLLRGRRGSRTRRRAPRGSSRSRRTSGRSTTSNGGKRLVDVRRARPGRVAEPDPATSRSRATLDPHAAERRARRRRLDEDGDVHPLRRRAALRDQARASRRSRAARSSGARRSSSRCTRSATSTTPTRSWRSSRRRRART